MIEHWSSGSRQKHACVVDAKILGRLLRCPSRGGLYYL